MDECVEKLNTVKQNCVKFYITLCKELKKRFNITGKLGLIQYLNPKEIYSGSLPLITPFLKAFPYSSCDIEKLNTQWRALIREKEIITKCYDDDLIQFWLNLKNVKNFLDENMFKDLANYMLELCAIPHSSAVAARFFSKINLLKTKKTNKLSIDSVKNTLLSRELVTNAGESGSGSSINWEPSNDLINFYNLFKLHGGEFKRTV